MERMGKLFQEMDSIKNHFFMDQFKPEIEYKEDSKDTDK